MRYKLLGRTGLRVSELCLGAMPFGTDAIDGSTLEDSRAVFDGFAAAGGNFIDTANVYQNGQSEQWLGDFLAGNRDDFVLATKYSLGRPPHNVNKVGNHRKSMILSVEGSLRRLKTDYLDLLWLHKWDGITPIEEVMRAMDDLVRAGKILHSGLSDTPAWTIAYGTAIAEQRGWTVPAAVQLPYSLAERDAEREYLPMARALGLTLTTWNGLAGGLLTGKFSPGAPVSGRRELMHRVSGQSGISHADFQLADVVCKVASRRGASPAQVALAWVRAQDPMIIPIVGARTPAQLEDNLGCLNITLTEAELEILDAARPSNLGFPGDFIRAPASEASVFGPFRDRIEARRPYGRAPRGQA